ncbi:leukemia-associated protein 7 [Petaurus breviceps papuanus]|uniref:leukemia-associated protein 7 n=1 Tax=Petaurus breviceps papuanus TaxID=3040969 RepID=UPI0036DCFC69
MAYSLSLQAAINHQIVALQTLRVLQEQRDRDLGQPTLEDVSVATEQAGPPEQPEKGEGPAEEKPGEEGNAVPQPWDPSQCSLARAVVRTVLARVVQTTAQLIQVEQTILAPLHQELNFPVYLKDSIEFRNICCHMAQHGEEPIFDQDLNAAYKCLKTIIKKLIHTMLSLPADVRALSCMALRQVLQNHLDL